MIFNKHNNSDKTHRLTIKAGLCVQLLLLAHYNILIKIVFYFSKYIDFVY